MKFNSVICICIFQFATFAAQAQQKIYPRYYLEVGQGYILCERLVKHLNEKTDNGQAPRLWRFYIERDPLVIIPYPQAQSYLTKEITSFPGFERPKFTEVILTDVRQLIELIGELDAINSTVPGQNEYSTTTEDLYRYIKDCRNNSVPAAVQAILAPYGHRRYKALEQGKARVYRLIEPSIAGADAVIQIEYEDFKGEPVSNIRRVNSDLTEPRPRLSIWDSKFESRGLVKWSKKYYEYSSSAPTSIEITAIDFATNPGLCRVNNDFRPQSIK
jgi:hypothetical protein